jgi:hypothetical protein
MFQPALFDLLVETEHALHPFKRLSMIALSRSGIKQTFLFRVRHLLFLVVRRTGGGNIESSHLGIYCN